MDSIWNTENFISLVATREAETGEWLGADALSDPIEGPDDYEPDDYDYDRMADAYERAFYGD